MWLKFDLLEVSGNTLMAKEIRDNYILFNKPKDFTQKTLTYFYKRLCMFLAIPPSKTPKLKFEEYDEPGSAYFEDPNDIGIKPSRHDYYSDTFKYKGQDLELDIDPKKVKYVIPLTTIYHELIHKVQFDFGMYDHIDLIEACADTYSYILTGQLDFDYTKECVALFNYFRNVLKIRRDSYYLIIRNIIVNQEDFFTDLYTSPRFMRELSKVSDGHINTFWNEFTGIYYEESVQPQMIKELTHFHNIIFYNY